MKDATNETNLQYTRANGPKRERSRYVPDAERCMNLPAGMMTARDHNAGTTREVKIEEATNSELADCLRLLARAMSKAGDPLVMILQHPKVVELVNEYVEERNGRILLQNPDFMEKVDGKANSPFFMPGKAMTSMITAQEAKVRRDAKLLRVKAMYAKK